MTEDLGLPTADELRERVRAAMGWAGIKRPQLCERTGISLASLKLYLSKDQPFPLDAAMKIGRATRVPDEFILNGWDGMLSVRVAKVLLVALRDAGLSAGIEPVAPAVPTAADVPAPEQPTT